jgi:hypothetical protein
MCPRSTCGLRPPAPTPLILPGLTQDVRYGGNKCAFDELGPLDAKNRTDLTHELAGISDLSRVLRQPPFDENAARPRPREGRGGFAAPGGATATKQCNRRRLAGATSRKRASSPESPG